VSLALRHLQTAVVAVVVERTLHQVLLVLQD
jgi:hypothetical protein